MKKWLLIMTLLILHENLFAAAQLAQISGTDLLKSAPLTLSAEGKKALVVVFLSAKCPCSNSHIQELKSLAKDYPEFSFVGVHSNFDEAPDLSKDYFEKAGLPFPIVQDQNLELANQYKALKTPHAFVIRPDGKMAYQGGVSSSRHFNEAGEKYLREALSDLQNNRPVKIPEGRTLGCVISRGEKNVW